MSERKLTKAQRSLARLAAILDWRCMTRADAARHGLLAHFERCRKAKLIRSAGYETTVAAEDWLNSDEGRAAMKEAGHE